jgi:esterase/lipase superfamily enzyme
MEIKLYFEFADKAKGTLAVDVNGEKLGLILASYQGKRLLSAIINVPSGTGIELTIISLTGAASVLIYAVLPDGREKSRLISLPGDRQSHRERLDADWLATVAPATEINVVPGFRKDRGRPTYKVPEKHRGRLILQKGEIRIDTIQPDYSYYDNQVSRDKLLTPTTEPKGSRLIEVFYATDRKAKIKKKGRLTYTNSRGDLQVGSCLVNVPNNKKKGEIPEKPWYYFGLMTDPDEDMFIKEVGQLAAGEFFKRIREQVANSPEKDVFIFIHGYNVSFTDSVLRAAQIKADIGFRGAPIVYSWPSRNFVGLYKADESTATGYSSPHIIQLLKDVRTTTGAERVHLIAHSMGNRFLSDALRTLVDQGFTKDFQFNQIILAAPDVDAEVFVKTIAPQMLGASQRITLYASSQDKPLWFSGKIHGNIQRAGAVTGSLAVVDGMDTVDASTEATDFFGHGYFAESFNLIKDVFDLTRHEHGPEDRNLRKHESDSRVYWSFE